MNLRRTLAVGRKEMLHVLRDSRSLAMALAVPVLMLLLFGVALSLDVDQIPTMIYDADRTASSRDLIEQFRGSRYFQILGFTDNYGAIEREIDRNRILLGVVIPADYSRKIGEGRPAAVQLLIDGSDSNTASIALGGSSDDNSIHHNVATTISSFGTGNQIHHNTTKLPIVDNSGGGNSLHDNTTDPSVCF